MNVGIVGHEAAKFTDVTEQAARQLILDLINPIDLESWTAPTVVSGHCHLGGIDIWAEEEANLLDRPKLIFPPKELNWTWFKVRNIQIAKASDIVHVILIDTYPPGYKGMRFTGCYHCDADKTMIPHIKSGGCWTGRYAKNTLKKPAHWHVIAPDGSLAERFYGHP